MVEDATTPRPPRCPGCRAEITSREGFRVSLFSQPKCAKCSCVLPAHVWEAAARWGEGRGDEAASPEMLAPVTGAASPRLPGEGAIEVLKLVAWLNLISGFILAVVFWVGEMGPLGAGLGAAFLVSGVIGCALLLVGCSMAENLFAIRRAVERATLRTEV